MSRVRVFGEFTGSNRTTTVGGRGRNDYMKSWINFDWFKKGLRPSQKRGAKPEDMVEYTLDCGTDAVQTVVSAHDNGSMTINISLPDLTKIRKDCIDIYISGNGMQSIHLQGKVE